MEAYLDWQNKSGGIKLNDVIEENRYVANGKAVKEGDFLTYVGEDVAPALEPPFNAVALSSGVGGTDTEHNEQVKIARLYNEVKYTANLFGKTWTEETAGTKYTSGGGFTLEASGIVNTNYTANLACNGISNDSNDRWTSQYSTTSNLTPWIKVILPKRIKITKMKTRIGGVADSFDNAVIQGSKDGNNWVDLYKITSIQTALTEVELNNPSYFNQYRILITVNKAGSFGSVYEWQTSEYCLEVMQ